MSLKESAALIYIIIEIEKNFRKYLQIQKPNFIEKLKEIYTTSE